jgi:hypothetical protein
MSSTESPTTNLIESNSAIKSLESKLATEKKTNESLIKDMQNDIKELVNLHTVIHAQILLSDDRIVLSGLIEIDEMGLKKVKKYLKLNTFKIHWRDLRPTIEFYNDHELEVLQDE